MVVWRWFSLSLSLSLSPSYSPSPPPYPPLFLILSLSTHLLIWFSLVYDFLGVAQSNAKCTGSSTSSGTSTSIDTRSGSRTRICSSGCCDGGSHMMYRTGSHVVLSSYNMHTLYIAVLLVVPWHGYDRYVHYSHHQCILEYHVSLCETFCCCLVMYDCLLVSLLMYKYVVYYTIICYICRVNWGTFGWWCRDTSAETMPEMDSLAFVYRLP